MVDEPSGAKDAPRWLTPVEQRAWRSMMRSTFELSWALGHQLQRTSDLSLVEYYALAILSAQPDRTMRMSELARLTQSSLSRLSRLVNRLEARGLVTREPDTIDGRYTLATLTDGGVDVLREAAPAHVGLVRRLVLDTVEPDQLEAVARVADAVQENVEAYRREVSGPSGA